MVQATPETFYASAERTSAQDIEAHHLELGKDATLTSVVNAMPNLVAILDENRQVVSANTQLLKVLGKDHVHDLLGLRPGEVLGCKNATVMEAGCGTSEACRTCGAINAILGAQGGTQTSASCQITVGTTNEALDLSVTASPVDFCGRPHTLLSLRDMSDDNRRRVLERTFFHDVLNAAGGASGIANLLNDVEDMDEVHEFAPLLVSVTEQMVGEINAQRDMLAAERGDLSVQFDTYTAADLVRQVAETYRLHPVAEGKQIETEISPQDSELHIQTSKTLFMRVLGNMVKNALEASEAGQTVRLGFSLGEQETTFWVNNATVMPREIQLQVFNRSFSTKGSGRGIGTYSIRLLGEKYLGGKVSFDSLDGAGTTFRIEIPTQTAM